MDAATTPVQEAELPDLSAHECARLPADVAQASAHAELHVPWYRQVWERHLRGLALAPAVAFAVWQASRRARDREQIVAWQRRRLRRLVRQAMQRVPYYRLFYAASFIHPDDVVSADDLARLPFLTRSDLQQLAPTLLAEGSRFLLSEVWTSSGTTGRPIRVLKPVAWQIGMFTRLQARGPQLGLRRSDFRLLAGNHVYVSDTEYRRPTRRITARMPIQRLSRFEKFDLRPEVGGDARVVLAEIHKLRPVYLTGKPSSLLRLAHMMSRDDVGGDFPIRPKVVVTGAEQLMPPARAQLSEAFGCPVFDAYGTAEVGPIACECAERSGMHVEDDEVIVEIVRDDMPVPPGESGEIVVTDLSNWAMPIIRYRTGDMGRLSYEPCPCGLAYPRLVQIEGRIVDMFIASSGERFNPFALIGELPRLGLKQYQLVQRALDEVLVRYVGDAPEQQVCAAVRPAALARMGPAAHVLAERVETLDVPGKKTRPYVNELAAGAE